MNLTEPPIAIRTISTSVWSVLKYLLYLAGAYLGSQVIKFVLDKYIKKLRFDKWILYLLLVRTPYAKTKVVLTTKMRPNLSIIRKKVETIFVEGLDLNELKGNSYLFKVKNHPTPIKLFYVEPTGENAEFTVVMETSGDDKINKIFFGSISKTMEIFETLSHNLKQLTLESITTTLKLNYVIPNGLNVNYQFKRDIEVGSKRIIVSTKQFTKVRPLIIEGLREWKITFI